MAQLTYSQDPAVAVAGMNAEPFAPAVVVSRIAEEDIGFGLAVKAGTNAAKEALLCADEADFIGIAIMSDHVEMEDGAVTTLAQAQANRTTAAYGEVAQSAIYKQFKTLPVMQMGVCYAVTGADLSSAAVGDELMCDASGKMIAALSPTARYRIFLEEVPESGADKIVKVRLSGPQGATA